ncbi:PAAR domain-containing protein [Kutzneria sp. CA-103260]|uniref:PAAR domain-containing protein n=1 Tax=Kutzneria sp. CA-103260 TaxID=2802641 RepID=UPI001BA47DAC|nr:PAAR domain-containing protein [Kutzneria sp. CA-103260]QUQ65635.1 PAAR motif protein [Kutzneria sp. CA-103260]
MGQPAAKQGDRITATDTHLVQTGNVTTPTPFPFNGILDGALSTNVRINGRFAATVDSTATNTPPHIPASGTFVKPPSNQGRVITGSLTVRINGKPAARNGDTALTCNDPVDLPVGTVVATGLVRIGG